MDSVEELDALIRQVRIDTSPNFDTGAGCDEFERNLIRAGYAAAQSEPQGVPREATDEMAESVKNIVSAYAAKKIWRQMLDAAPPATPDKVSGEAARWHWTRDGMARTERDDIGAYVDYVLHIDRPSASPPAHAAGSPAAGEQDQSTEVAPATRKDADQVSQGAGFIPSTSVDPPTPDDGRSRDAELLREACDHIGELLLEIFAHSGGTDHYHPENKLRNAVLSARSFLVNFNRAKTGGGNG